MSQAKHVTQAVEKPLTTIAAELSDQSNDLLQEVLETANDTVVVGMKVWRWIQENPIAAATLGGVHCL